ncbi:MAG: ABC transporter permease [Eubacteriales bacterium]|nr:ABC transporter permease [Eubacteriales bacterium]
MNLLSQMCVNALLASGLSFAIILGGIDISVGSQMAVTGVVAALIASKVGQMNSLTALFILILSAIVIGVIIGGVIGSLIAYGGLIPMICTLAFLTILRGLAYIISGGGPIYGLDSNFGCLGAKRLIVTGNFPNGMIPTSVIFTVIIVFIMHFILSKTIFGRHVFAVGSNKNVAHLAGIDVKKVTLISHMLCSVTACMAGVVTASKLQNGQPNIGEGYEMFAIASCVLGGTSLNGGRGSVARAMFGVAVIAVINNGMNLLNISAYWQKVVIGTIIIIAVLADTLQQKRTQKN